MPIDIDKNRRYIREDGVRAAFDTLVAKAVEYGITATDLTGFITGLKFHRDKAYVFAVQSNAHHLNFYVRTPAMKRWGPLAQRVAPLNVTRENKKGELQIHIRGAKDAAAVADTLFKLP